MANGHGGYRAPRNPAPASGVGKDSRRTDGPESQPIRAYNAEKHGDRQRLVQQQQMAPLAQEGGAPTPQPGAGPGAQPMPAGQGVFGATQRPGEPATAGVPFGPGPGPMTTPESEIEDLLRAAYAVHPSPYLLDLIRRIAR